MKDEKRNRMRPEFEFVLCCARAKCAANDERISALLRNGLNWSEVLACAMEHKLAPIVCERIRALDSDAFPKNRRDALTEFARNIGMNNLGFLSELLGLSTCFQAAQIPAVPFKGPALAWLAYRNFSYRSCGDLDFVMPQRYIPEATSLLRSKGYIPQFDRAEAGAGKRGPAPGQYAFAPTGNHCYVELHTERTLRYFSRPLNFKELNARLISLEIGAQTVQTFSVEDLLVMLSVHGAKHFWDRLAWIVDIAQLVTNCDVDWQLLLEIAAKMKSTRSLLLGLSLAHEMIGAPLPQWVMERARQDGNLQWLANRVIQEYEGHPNSSVGVLPRALFRFRSSDGRTRGLYQLLRLSLSPTESDRRKIKLPAVFAPLYSLVRPLRLLEEYGIGIRRRAKPDLAIYEPTPPEIVDRMLRLAGISSKDVLYDLGCGDGRIVVAAAKKYGIRAVGVDINPKRISEARENARRHGVENRARFILGDAKRAKFEEATVVTMFLGSDGNLRLADQLREQLSAGARIVSRNFQIHGWPSDQVEECLQSDGVGTTLYLWKIRKTDEESPEKSLVSPEATVPH